ncbi:hypothetical protein BCR34DRAFT_583247 [Clohesyomyces aquaticus]|uniref:Uncharacterized protein n=1 Tax=Clohesyomyces aquaticus TaxID=1231657 RepID=A0A1Y2A637_9PLEO|nr:hypothetical protein BCR34DRAFT_583247 [Clohesyomyces aquaticus]
MLDSITMSTLVLLGTAAALLLAATVYPSNFLRWLQRKRYQYEVTFSLYMLTATEKFIFNSILFLLLSLLIIAASLYLPEHIHIILNRLFYYWSGSEDSLADNSQQVLTSTSKVLRDAATSFLGMPPAGGLAGQGRGYMTP